MKAGKLLEVLTESSPLMLGVNLGRTAAQLSGLMAGADLDTLRRYEWLRFPKIEDYFSSGYQHRSLPYWTAMLRTASYIGSHIIETLKRAQQAPERVIWHEDTVAPDILCAMDLVPILVELVPLYLPALNVHLGEHYIDVAENAGYPADICSLNKLSLGMVLEDQLPPPRAIVANNAPCDGGMSSYNVIERVCGVPSFRLDLPYNFDQDRAVAYYQRELTRMISWCEEQFGWKLDIDRLREICTEKNRYLEYSLELWDLLRCRPAPLGGEPMFNCHLAFHYGGGSPQTTQLMRDMLHLARRAHERGRGGIPDERHRVILWNPPTAMYPQIWPYLERTYGAMVVMDMMTFHQHRFIDTSSEHTMLRDLARIMAACPMARHTRGPYENFFRELYLSYESFCADMIVMAAHQGCKNTRALLGIMREQCRKRGMPLLIIDYDLCDTRVTSPDMIQRMIDDFMENVMGERT
jgi:benzoyl-CoA reductase subunit B